MWQFKKQAKIKPLEWEDSTKGVLNGECYIFPLYEYHQIPCSLWWQLGHWIYDHKKTGKLAMGYGDKEVDDGERGRVFRKFIKSEMEDVYAPFFREHNDLMLFGGFSQEKSPTFDITELVFLVWDVYDSRRAKYMNYENYGRILDEYKIKYLPAICRRESPSYESVIEASFGDVIIKNYSLQNPIWATVIGINKEYYRRGFFQDYGRHNPGYFTMDK